MKKKKVVANIVKVYQTMLYARQEEGLRWLWIREIARRADLHPEIVRRILYTYLREAIEELDVELLMEKGLRIRPVQLKERVNIKGHIRYLRLMGRL